MVQPSHEGSQLSSSIYLKTWGVLLILTLTMIGIEGVHGPKVLVVLGLLAFMLGKATLIGGNFMHLRREHRNLILTIIVGLLVTGAILFGLLSIDSLRVLHLSGV